MMSQRETDTHSAALRDLVRAETARDQYEGELTEMVRRLRRAIAAGLVSEGTGEFIRTGRTEQMFTDR